MRATIGGRGRVRSFWVQRSRAQRGTLVATGVVVAVVAVLASVMTGLALRSPDAAVRATLTEEPAGVTSLAVQGSRSDDPEAQDAAVRAIIGQRFPEGAVAVAATASV